VSIKRMKINKRRTKYGIAVDLDVSGDITP
jgi:hypothetical protein